MQSSMVSLSGISFYYLLFQFFTITFCSSFYAALCASFRKPLTANDMFIIKCWNSLNMQRDGSVKCSNRLSRERVSECNTKWQSFRRKTKPFLMLLWGKEQELPPPAACNLQLTQVNRRSKYWTKAGIKLYIYALPVFSSWLHKLQNRISCQCRFFYFTHTQTHIYHIYVRIFVALEALCGNWPLFSVKSRLCFRFGSGSTALHFHYVLLFA